MKDKKLGRVIAVLLECLLALLISAGLYYLILPPFNVHSMAFWGFLFLVLAIFAVCLGVFNGKAFEQILQKKDIYARNRKKQEKQPLLAHGMFSRVFLVITVLPIVVIVIGAIFSSTVFNAYDYAKVITVDEREFEADMPEINEVTNIALMDTESAKILGNRKLGALANVVSQFEMGENYSQINFRGSPMKIVNLEYAGFFKWINNRDTGVPGYIMVDPLANTSEYYELPSGMRYTESAYFGDDLMRKLRFDYPTKIFDNVSFEADENGNVFFIVSCSAPRVGLFGAMDINEVIIFDPVSGNSTLYQLADVPTWVDIVFDGYRACEKYDWYGTLSGGFINSIIGNKGCKETTADFGYIMLDDDVWYFTGVTSVTSDASNIGFILTCARTGEYKFYSVIGAEEYSAMGAAEGEVQEKEYVASFPSLVNIAGEPSYIMVLKDANGLVKLYALVNVQQYSIVATGETQSDAIAAYIKLLAQNGIDTSSTVTGEETVFRVAEIRYLDLAGVTNVYLTDISGNVYSMEFNSHNEGIVLVQSGDHINVTWSEDPETGIRRVGAWSVVPEADIPIDDE